MLNLSIGRLRNVWQDARSSLWFQPAALGILAIILSYVVPAIDTHLPRQIAVHRGWLFYGSPDAARTLLSTLASSLITVISLLFSITMLTMQQASSQFTSRVLRNFTNDHGVQWVLGTYIATFVYCILVLRRVRSSTIQTENFVPVLSITLAIVLALVCVGLLVYYVHHIAMMLQAATVVERVHDSLVSAIEENYPDKRDDSSSSVDAIERAFPSWNHGHGFRLLADTSGYLRSIDEDIILKTIPHGAWARIELPLGEYVVVNSVLLEANAEIDSEDDVKKINGAFILGQQRTLPDDTLFGMRQLVDIALRSLSPAINNSTTAEHVVSALSDALIRLGEREFPPRVKRRMAEDGNETAVLWVNRPGFDDFVNLAYPQIRRASRNDVNVTMHLIRMMRTVVHLLSEERARPIWTEMAKLVTQIEESSFIPADKAMLLDAANAPGSSGSVQGRVSAGG